MIWKISQQALRRRAIGSALTLALALAVFGASLGGAQRASADSFGYCNTLVASGFAPCAQGTTRLYNFNRNLANLSISAVCATVGYSVVSDPTAGIYGSGCGLNTNRYSFCHALIGNSRHAWVSQNSLGGANRTLAGLAVNNLGNCAYAPYFAPNESSLIRPGSEPSSEAADVLRSDFRALASEPVTLPAAVNAVASLDVSDTTEVRAVGPDSDVYLIPGSKLTCIGRSTDSREVGAVVACADTDGYADMPRLAFSAAEHGQTTVWGAVPDGVSAVTVNSAKGPVEANVRNNGFVLTVARASSVIVESDSGSTTLAIPASTVATR